MPAETQTGKPRIDLSRYELTVDRQRARLERQPMELLIFFVQRQGQLVSREDIVEKLWGKDVFVDVDRSINAAVRKIRSALKDDSAAPKYLETVVGKGYRFVGEVEVVGTVSPVLDKVRTVEPTLIPARGQKSIPRVLLGLLVTVVLVAGAWAFWRWGSTRTSPDAYIHSIVVLPLANLSGDPSQDYFADGITEELTNDLGKISSLKVISRTSAMHYKNSHETLPQIARDLNVEAAVEGSVLRSGDRVRITAQLINAHSDRDLWSESYERDLKDVLTLQNEVASAIAERVRAQMTPHEEGQLASRKPVNPAAYDAYLRGRYCWNERTDASLHNAAEYFRRAIALDRTYAPAYSGLADVLVTRAHYGFDAPKSVLPEASSAALQAVELEEGSAEAHTSLANFYIDNWNWGQVEAEFHRAISLNPRYATAHHWYSDYLSAVGRHNEAIAEEKRALELDPLSPIINTWMGRRYYHARQYQKGYDAVKTALELDPSFEPGLAQLGLICVQMKRFDEATAALTKASQSSGHGLFYLSVLAYSYASSGKPEQARKVVAQLTAESEKRYVPSYMIAEVYVALNDRKHGLQWLSRAYDEHSDWMMYLRIDPALDPIRSDPRFAELVRQVGIP